MSFPGHSYSDRLQNLRLLGFFTYKEYLASPLWESIRRRVLAEKGPSCRLCGVTTSILHHNRYALQDLDGRCTHWINPVCRHCHLEVEEDHRGRKRSVREASREFYRRLDARAKNLGEILVRRSGE